MDRAEHLAMMMRKTRARVVGARYYFLQTCTFTFRVSLSELALHIDISGLHQTGLSRKLECKVRCLKVLEHLPLFMCIVVHCRAEISAIR